MVFGRYKHADGQLCFTSLVRPADSSPGSTRNLPPYPACDVFVRDQDRSLRFYLDQLGFSLVADYRYGSNERWVAVAPADGSAVLALVTPKPSSEEYNLIGQSRQIVFVTEDVPAKFREWCDRGIQFRHPPHTPEWGHFHQLRGCRRELLCAGRLRRGKSRNRSTTPRH